MAVYENNETKRIMARVQKMLRLGNDPGAAEGERDTAMRMAHALLAKYNLDLAEIEATSNGDAAKSASVEPRVDHTAIFVGYPWARSICASIADLFFCTYLSGTYGGGKAKHYFIGRTSNAVTASLVAEFVVKSVFREAARAQRAAFAGTEFHRSFSWGAAMKIRERVNALKTDKRQVEPTTSTPGTSLVLASLYDTEARANQVYVAQKWPKLGKARSGKGTTNYEAVARGKAYGATVSLNPQVK